MLFVGIAFANIIVRKALYLLSMFVLNGFIPFDFNVTFKWYLFEEGQEYNSKLVY